LPKLLESCCKTAGFCHGVADISRFWNVASVGWQLATEISGQCIGPNFKVKQSKKSCC